MSSDCNREKFADNFVVRVVWCSRGLSFGMKALNFRVRDCILGDYEQFFGRETGRGSKIGGR